MIKQTISVKFLLRLCSIAYINQRCFFVLSRHWVVTKDQKNFFLITSILFDLALQTSSARFTTQKTLLSWLYFITFYPNPNAASLLPSQMMKFLSPQTPSTSISADLPLYLLSTSLPLSVVVLGIFFFNLLCLRDFSG